MMFYTAAEDSWEQCLPSSAHGAPSPFSIKATALLLTSPCKYLAISTNTSTRTHPLVGQTRPILVVVTMSSRLLWVTTFRKAYTLTFQSDSRPMALLFGIEEDILVATEEETLVSARFSCVRYQMKSLNSWSGVLMPRASRRQLGWCQ